MAARSLGAGTEVDFDRTLMREANVVGGALSDASRDIRLYMREISHRSKNLLAVVQSIARQTRRNSTDLRDFGQRFDDRLHSLARSHDLLVERNWNGTFAHELVRAQLRSFVEDDDVRVEIRGDPVLLSPAASQHIGLALHELATNASKYGALSVQEGRVHVAWSKGPGSDGTERFRMSWQESGGPALSEPSRKGFGRYVVEEAVARGVTGAATIHWNPDGLLWILDAPANCLISEAPFELNET
jgi:two-component sensor histidine kinase